MRRAVHRSGRSYITATRDSNLRNVNSKLAIPSATNEQGYVLGLVMVFFIIFSLMGLAIVKMGSHESVQAVNQYDRVRAFFNAEAGIHEGLWRINKVSNAAGTFADATVTVVYDSVGLVLTATGSAGSIQDSIRVTLNTTGGTSSGGWPYAIFTDEDELRLDEGSGTVTGDVHSNYDVDKDNDYTVNGTITEGTPNVTPPTITWSFFETAAVSAGQFSSSDLIFTSAGSPYTGVWYTEDDAKIYSGAIINGTIVAEDKIEFEGDNASLTATPSNYPALLCQNDIEGYSSNNIAITGLVYAADHFDKDFANFTLTGAIIALDEFHHYSQNFVVTYDATYTTNVAGTDIGGVSGGTTLTIATWEDL